jgi:hypothetical protein
MKPDPELVSSKYSGPVTRQGITVQLAIYRLDGDLHWVLEVVNENGTSTVWDELFDTDSAAYDAFQSAVEEEGMSAFLDKTDGVTFSTRH